jgi:hypothetical protein
MGQTQLVYEVGWEYNGVYKLKFRENKKVKVLILFFSLKGLFFIMGFQ